MKLDLSAHDEDAHGAIKTADGRLVVPFVLLLASLKGDRPWRVAMTACIDALRQASPQEWATLSPGGWAVFTSSFRQFMFPPPDSSTETQSQLDALQKHAGSVRDLSSLTAACGSFAIDLEDVRRVFPELEIVGLPPAAASWQERALELASNGKKPKAIADALGLAVLLGVEQEAARKKVERLIRKAKEQPFKHHWPGLGGASAAS